jgi:hypothetical protein
MGGTKAAARTAIEDSQAVVGEHQKCLEPTTQNLGHCGSRIEVRLTTQRTMLDRVLEDMSEKLLLSLGWGWRARIPGGIW